MILLVIKSLLYVLEEAVAAAAVVHLESLDLYQTTRVPVVVAAASLVSLVEVEQVVEVALIVEALGVSAKTVVF